MYIFNATVHQQTDAFAYASQISVTQKIDANSSIVVAHIEDSADPMDHRSTTINYAEGSLCFSAAYDGPIQQHTILPFSDFDISLHIFYVGGGKTLSYLCSENGFFPIHIDRNDNNFKISIYKSFPIPQEDGLLHPLLATITKTKKHTNGFEYTIQTNELSPLPLLMAIFSLPFTLNLRINQN